MQRTKLVSVRIAQVGEVEREHGNDAKADSVGVLRCDGADVGTEIVVEDEQEDDEYSLVEELTPA